ncbi:MAG: septum formation initiator family protein [Candidatus Babeliales bacterium]
MIPKKRSVGRVLAVGLCCAWGFFFTFGRYGIQDYFAMHHEIDQLHTTIAQTEQAIKITKRAIVVWNGDDVERQRCLRQDFYMCGTNELIYRV